MSRAPTTEYGLSMTTDNNPTAQTLDQLGAKTSEAVVETFAEVRRRFDKDAADSSDRERFRAFVLRWTGRKAGVLTQITDNWLKPATPELKRVVGQELNKLKAHVETTIEEKRKEIEAASEQSASARDKIDLSLPGIERAFGTRHLIRQTFEELQRIFTAIGFSVVEGPEIETPYYNFEALNIPEHHPARDNMDTFYIEGARTSHLLRTHTSPMQIRTMEKEKPPVRIVVPGKVYRRDNPDATHGYMFHQIEGLAVDTDITFCDFKGTVEYFAREFLGPKTKTRLRPSYFPFTEPSAEVDATCHVCGGKGCRVCKFSGWIELFGAGMVNPAVYGFVKYDPERLSGFAFGMGVDRLAMMKYGVTEVPLLFQNDVRFLQQFP
ncbi:MAG TPA: phenylalanine--tRNA ligase subunit alpha [Candidatus Sulfotelmatobacter sp.]|nr:phenylalanine--tRNA ligase subunit alpha [Candidatus Sulfotelmatobacter sp.]